MTIGSIAVAGAALGLAPPVAAAPSGSTSAAETIDNLRAKGYNVQVNGTRNGPLSNCSVDAVRGPSSTTPGSTVYVDLNCPAEYMY